MAQTIKEIREAYGLNQTQFAAVLQISRASLSGAESGRLPLPVNAMPWVKWLGGPDSFVGWEDKVVLCAAAQRVVDGTTSVTAFWSLIIAANDDGS